MKTMEKNYNNTLGPKKVPYEGTTAYNGRLKFKFLNFTTCAHFTVRNLNYKTRIIMPVVKLACTYQ
jgi:hypothetical protein